MRCSSGLALGQAAAADGEAGAAKKPAAPSFATQVNGAIDKGVAWLKKSQQKDGSWGPCVASTDISYNGSRVKDRRCHPTGPTSFALFTLAKCGVPRRDPVMKRGVAWIRKQVKRVFTTQVTADGLNYDCYESSSIILMLTAMYDAGKEMRAARSPTSKPRGSPFSKSAWRLMHDCVEHLVGGEQSGGGQTPGGGWAYWLRSKSSDADASSTQFALLALRAAVRAGYPLERQRAGVWGRALDFLLRLQKGDGAFPYKAGEPWTAGMTAAGAASLLICREQLKRLGEEREGLDGAIDRGLANLGKHYDPAKNVGEKARGGYHFCYLYAVERVGALAKRHLLGKQDWYRTGATQLLAWQAPGGQWRDRTCMAPEEVLGTCFALLFLKRATAAAVVTGK